MVHVGQNDFKQYSTYGKWRLLQYKNWNLCLHKAQYKYKYISCYTKTAATKKLRNLNKTSEYSTCNVNKNKTTACIFRCVTYLILHHGLQNRFGFCTNLQIFISCPQISFVHRTIYVSGNITIFWDSVRTFSKTVLCPSSGSSRCHWDAGIHLANYTVP